MRARAGQPGPTRDSTPKLLLQQQQQQQQQQRKRNRRKREATKSCCTRTLSAKGSNSTEENKIKEKKWIKWKGKRTIEKENAKNMQKNLLDCN